MSQHQVMLGLDQGTGSSRAALIDARGRILGLGTAAVKRTVHPNGWIDVDAEHCFQSLRLAVRRCFAAVESKRFDVCGVGLACQRSTSVLFRRKTGQPLAPAISWQCNRTHPQIEALGKSARQRLQARCGLPVVPHYAATKLAWLLERAPKRRSADLAAGTLDAYLAFQLTGTFVTDLSQATRTMLVDLGSEKWSKNTLKLFQLPQSLLPEIVPTMTPGIPVRARALPNIPQGTPLWALAGDQQAALFATGIRQPGDAKITFGSGAFLLAPATAQAAKPQASRCIRSVAWNTAAQTTYLLESNLPASGSVIRWIEQFTGQDFGRLLRRDRSRQQWATASATTTFVPAFSGMGPLWPSIAGGGRLDALHHDFQAPQLASAFALALGGTMAESLRVVEHTLHKRIRQILVDGGGSQDRVFLQIQADLMQRPLLPTRHREGTVFGAAALAWQAATGKAPVVATANTAVRPKLSQQAAKRILRHWLEAVDALASGR